MKAMHVQNSIELPTSGDEANIINRRELMPLLAKAWQVLKHYDSAMDCSATVVDSFGKGIPVPETPDNKRQMRFCEFCKMHSHNPSQIWQGSEYPCKKIHEAAIAESRRIEGVYIYICAAGFVYWTSPLYRSGRYAGALLAGQVILGGRGRVLEKFRALCKDNIAAQKFSAMIQDAPEKTHDEIQTMAQMLGLCAEEISEKKEDTYEILRRKAGVKSWQNMNHKSFKEPFDAAAKNNGSPQAEDTLEYPLEKERMLFAAFRRGDKQTGARILKELMDYILTAMPGDLETARFRAIELAVLLSRAAISDADGSAALLETNNRYLRRMLESKTPEELLENLHLAAESMAGKIFFFQGIRHASVLRKAERYIWANYTRKISLEEIAQASGLSSPYFSTIFKEEMGENLSAYLNRLRVERASAMLMETGKHLNEIAKLCGFEDQSWFSKIFKSFTGMSPGKFRKNGGGNHQVKAGRGETRGGITFPQVPKREVLSQ